MFPIPLSPKTIENAAIYTVFFNFSMLANSNIYTKNHSNTLLFYSVFTMFSVENTVMYTFFGIKSVQNTGFCSVFKALASTFNSLISPNPWKHRYLHCFLQFFHVPMPLAIYTKNHSNTLFFQCFYIFSVENTVIYTFFGLKSVQNTGFGSVFNALASKNHSKYRYLQCFFICVRFFHCRKPTKMTQNSISIPS